MAVRKASTQSASLVGKLNNAIVQMPVDDVSLSELNDVEIVMPKEGEFLVYDGNVWKNINFDEYISQNIYILDGGNASGVEMSVLRH